MSERKEFELEDLKTATTIAKEFSDLTSSKIRFCGDNGTWYKLRNVPCKWERTNEAAITDIMLEELELKKEVAEADVRSFAEKLRENTQRSIDELEDEAMKADEKKVHVDTKKLKDEIKRELAEERSKLGEYMQKELGWITRMENGEVWKVEKLMRGMQGTYVRMADFNRHPELYATRYGILNTLTGEYNVITIEGSSADHESCDETNAISKHHTKWQHDNLSDWFSDRNDVLSESLITRTMDAVYDPDANWDDWEVMLNDVFPNPEIKEYFEQSIGYTFEGSHTEQVFFEWSGLPNTAKSTILKGIRAAAGDHVVNAKVETFTLSRFGEPARFGLSSIIDATMVVVPELPVDRAYNHPLIKSYATGEIQRCEEKGKPEYDAKPRGVLFLLTNHEMYVDPNEARSMQKRVRVIPFLRVFEGSGLAEVEARIAKCRSGILNWIIMCIKKYRANGRLIEPEIIKDFTNREMMKSRPIKLYLDMTLEKTDNEKDVITAAELVDGFNIWYVNAQGGKPYDPRPFYKVCRQEGYNIESGAHNVNVLKGYRVKETEKPEKPEEPITARRENTIDFIRSHSAVLKDGLPRADAFTYLTGHGLIGSIVNEEIDELIDSGRVSARCDVRDRVELLTWVR